MVISTYNATATTLSGTRDQVRALIPNLVSGDTLIVKMRAPTISQNSPYVPGVVQTTPVVFDYRDSKADVRIVYEASRAEAIEQGVRYTREGCVVAPASTGSWGAYSEAYAVGPANSTSGNQGFVFFDSDMGIPLGANPAPGSMTKRVMKRAAWTHTYADMVIDAQYDPTNSFWGLPENRGHVWKFANTTLQTAWDNAGGLVKQTNEYCRIYKTLPVSNTTGPMVTFDGCEGITFKHFTFRDIHTAQPESIGNQSGYLVYPAGELGAGAVDCKNSKNISIEECAFIDINGHNISASYGSTDVRISKCSFTRIGGNGFNSKKNSDGVSTHSGVLVEDSTFTNCGYFYFGAVPITLYAAHKALVQGNTIVRCPYTGITIGDQWGGFDPGTHDNVIKDNTIIGSCQINYDGGPIYTLARNEGLKILNNTSIFLPKIRVTSSRVSNAPIDKAEAYGAVVYLDNLTQGSAKKPIVVAGNKALGVINMPNKPPTVFYQNVPGSEPVRSTIIDAGNTSA